MKKDEELVTKGEAKKALIKGLFRDRVGRCSSLDVARIQQSIDALDPVPMSKTLSNVEGAEDAVSRDVVLRSLDITREKLAPSLNEGQHLDLIRLGQLIAKLPSVSVSPAQAAGPEEPDYKTMWEELQRRRTGPSYSLGTLLRWIEEIEVRHTPAKLTAGKPATGQAKGERDG